MKTAFDLPSDLVHAIKLRAVHENRRFKEVAAESLCSAIGQGESPIPLPQKGPIKLPLFATTPGAPASQMSATALIALEQTPQLDEDHASHG
jgi:hypothetical protein